MSIFIELMEGESGYSVGVVEGLFYPIPMVHIYVNVKHLIESL